MFYLYFYFTVFTLTVIKIRTFFSGNVRGVDKWLARLPDARKFSSIKKLGRDPEPRNEIRKNPGSGSRLNERIKEQYPVTNTKLAV
jgi:hypothetical protein